MNTATRTRSIEKRRVMRPITVANLAQIIGVSRQRLYLLVQRGTIHATKMAGGVVIEPDEANRVINCATVVDSLVGPRILFDFNRI